MALVKHGGHGASTANVMTTMGLRAPRPPVCTSCRERKVGQLYTTNANGQVVCGDCSGSVGRDVLRGVCDPENCACGDQNDETDPE